MPTNGTGNTRVERRLAAILAADIAGYSALMGADEARMVSGYGPDYERHFRKVFEDGRKDLLRGAKFVRLPRRKCPSPLPCSACRHPGW